MVSDSDDLGLSDVEVIMAGEPDEIKQLGDYDRGILFLFGDTTELRRKLAERVKERERILDKMLVECDQELSTGNK